MCIYSSLETWARTFSSPKKSWRQLVPFPISLLGREGSVAMWCWVPTSHHVNMCRWKDLELALGKKAEKESMCGIRRKKPREGRSHFSTLAAASQLLPRKPESCSRWFPFPLLLALSRSSKLPLTSLGTYLLEGWLSTPLLHFSLTPNSQVSPFFCTTLLIHSSWLTPY